MKFETNTQHIFTTVGAGPLRLIRVEMYGEAVTDDAKPAHDLQAGTPCP